MVTGSLADRLDLVTAMRIVPLAAIGALVMLVLGRRAYPAGLTEMDETLSRP